MQRLRTARSMMMWRRRKPGSAAVVDAIPAAYLLLWAPQPMASWLASQPLTELCLLRICGTLYLLFSLTIARDDHLFFLLFFNVTVTIKWPRSDLLFFVCVLLCF